MLKLDELELLIQLYLLRTRQIDVILVRALFLLIVMLCFCLKISEEERTY